MDVTEQWVFGPFRLDPSNVCLWRGEQPIALRPKLLALLVFLVRHAGQLVAKEALLEAVWPETAVSDAVLKDAIGRLRRVLGETARAPQFIATVHRQGYRFIASVHAVAPAASVSVPEALPAGGLMAPPEHLVGREAELAQMHQWWAWSCQGTRQLVFVTGEAGIGKTTLVDAFVAQLPVILQRRIGRGQCIEQYGSGEAYLPLLEALGQLGQGSEGPQLVELLRQQAPSWLRQLPALLSDAAYGDLQRRTSGITQERMLRELADAMEAWTAAAPLVLVLEDLHWSDEATLTWLAYMARRRATARLLILGTYRPVEASMRAHAVQTITHDLLLHDQSTELVLGYLPEAGVAAYLAQRFGAQTELAGLVPMLHQRTNGNPLFLVTMVRELVRQEVLREGAAGWELAGGPETIAVGAPVSLRARWHQQIGLRLEVGYASHVRQIAAELAEHFVRGRDAQRAVQYLQYAGEHAAQRSANQEAIRHLTTGLELLRTLPDSFERTQQEIVLHITLGGAWAGIKGYSAPEVRRLMIRRRSSASRSGRRHSLRPYCMA